MSASTIATEVALTRRGQVAHWASIVVGLVAITIGIAGVVRNLTAWHAQFGQHVFDSPMGIVSAFAAGVLLTAVFQSSTITSSLIVLGVASAELNMAVAVAAIFGTNLGAVVTPLLLSYVFARRRNQFRAAFEVACSHLWVNLLGVLILLPVELLFHPLSWAAHALAHQAALPPTVRLDVETFSWWHLGWSLILTMVGLLWTRTRARKLVRGVGHRFLEHTAGLGDTLGLATGLLSTMVLRHSAVTIATVQAFHVTESISLRHRLSVVLGANMGTTLTALLIAVSLDSALATEVAFVHLMFNLVCTMSVLLCAPLRRCIDQLAARTAQLGTYSYVLTALAIGSVWFAIPAFIVAQ